MAALALYVGNHAVVELQELTNTATGAPQTTATVTVTIKDMTGAAVSGQLWPALMSHVAAGTYRATLDADLAITDGQHYTAVIDAETSDHVIGHWELEVRARTRRA